jgi:release factor glutamine methyltransferase
VALEVPQAQVHAVEADPLALAYAKRNIAAYAEREPYAGRRVSLLSADFGDVLRDRDGTLDLVVSNPPYIPLGAWVAPEVAEYDPPSALWGGDDGLDAVKVVQQTAARLLRDGGLVAVEHGAPQGPGVRAVFTAAGGWRDVTQHQDLAGRDRFVTAIREWQDEVS